MRHRDFRLFIFGQVVSLTGTWMQNLAQSWLVWRLTQSAAMVGLVGFASHLPILLLGPLGGLAADRYPRRRIVLVTQVLFLAQASCFAALALTDRISVPLIVILALAWGLINAFDIPARQSLFIHLVGKDDLLSAISLNSVTFNSARVVGPSVAGFLVAALGEGLCFLLNAVTFLPVIGSLLLMRVVEPAREAASAPLRHLREGFQYAWRNREIRGLLGLTAAVNFAGAPAFVLAPVVADAVFGRGSQGLGILLGAFGLGAVVGTAALASRKAVGSHQATISASALGMAAGLTLYAWAPLFPVAVLALVATGFSIMRQLAATNTEIQTIIDDAFRGRVMAMYSMVVVGMLPLGSLAAGSLASLFGVRPVIFAGALICLAGVILWRRSLVAEDHS